MYFNDYATAWSHAEPKINALCEEIHWVLKRVAESIGSSASVCAPFRMDDKDNTVTIRINVKGADGETDEDASVDVSVTLADAGSYDGFDAEDPEWGVNIMISVCTQAGKPLANFTPYNYSDRVWTRDSEELDRRISLHDTLGLEDNVLAEHFNL